MVLITIVNGVYKPTYNWGAPHCRHWHQLYQENLMVGVQLISISKYGGLSSGILGSSNVAGWKIPRVDDIVPLKKGISIATFDSRVVLIDG